MLIPTNDDILHLLDQLDHSIADDLESIYLDFKPWDDPKGDMKVAIEYAVCFSNADGGVVVFGVSNKRSGVLRLYTEQMDTISTPGEE